MSPNQQAGAGLLSQRLWTACSGLFIVFFCCLAQAQRPTWPIAAPEPRPSPVVQALPEAASGWQSSPSLRFPHRAVVTAHPLASQAANAILEQGGNAVDAAIAAQWVLGLVEPQSSGPGGGAFVILSTPAGVMAHDGRETAPQAARADQFLVNGRPMSFTEATRQPQSVGVPGLVAMLWSLHRTQGRLDWGQLTQPAHRLARQGFPMSPRLHRLLQEAGQDLDPASRAIYLNRAGQPKPVGSRIRNPGYARLMSDLARHGPQAFYEGPWAKALIARVQDHGRHWFTREDLLAYRPVVRPALCQVLAPTPAWPQGLEACGMPAPSSGQLAIGQILGIWDQLGLRLLTEDGQWRASSAHAWVEATRLALADRARYVADPDFTPGLIEAGSQSLSPAYLRQRASLVTAQRLTHAPAGQWGAMPALSSMADQLEQGTSHLSLVDGQGQALAMTTTIEQAFGSRRLVTLPGLPGGYWLNNQLTDFSFVPQDVSGQAVANRVQAGKRPRSSMSPMVVLARSNSTPSGPSEPIMVLGSPGGAAILSYVASRFQALREGLPVQTAVELPNLAVVAPEGPVVLESGRMPEEVEQGLMERGHSVVRRELTSGLGLLMKSAQGWHSGVDPRREGLAVGK